MHTIVQINKISIGNEMLFVKIVYTFHLVYIQCIIQMHGKYPTEIGALVYVTVRSLIVPHINL